MPLESTVNVQIFREPRAMDEPQSGQQAGVTASDRNRLGAVRKVSLMPATFDG